MIQLSGPLRLTVKTYRKRTIVSAITYRVTSTLLLAVISFAVTGLWFESILVTLTFAFFATVLFYFNDRAWERTDWGRRAEGPMGVQVMVSSLPGGEVEPGPAPD